MKNILIIVITIFTLGACKSIFTSTIDEKHLQADCISKLDEVIVYDIYSPPVASRIYAYCNLAFYEAIKYKNKNATSITDKLQFFDVAIKLPTQKIDYNLSAVAAFFATAKVLCFSKDSVVKKQDFYLTIFKQKLNKDVYNSSLAFGETVAQSIIARASKDNYKHIKGLPKYTVVKEKNTWEQTPPDYADAIEPNWQLLKPLLIDSTMYECVAPPIYSENKNTQYYKEVSEVYEISQTKNSSMDSIAKYWDDNPFVTEHKGHYVAATKKITPVGHWMGITSIICDKQNADIVTTAKAFALSSSAIYDGFIACWYQKYKTQMPRPITVIRRWFKPTWSAYLQTPPFPEYTSGHSVISKAAAAILTNLFGNNISFTDTTELKYLGLQRSFTSINAAADEAGISRLYGGIHFKSAIENGKAQGEKIGEYYYQKFK